MKKPRRDCGSLPVQWATSLETCPTVGDGSKRRVARQTNANEVSRTLRSVNVNPCSLASRTRGKLGLRSAVARYLPSYSARRAWSLSRFRSTAGLTLRLGVDSCRQESNGAARGSVRRSTKSMTWHIISTACRVVSNERGLSVSVINYHDTPNAGKIFKTERGRAVPMRQKHSTMVRNPFE
jgi:hypothetical protein